MASSVFEFDDYKAYFLSAIEAMPNAGRGVRRQLGEFIGCQVAYISHVLAAEKHFSLEQAEAAARFFALRDDEKDFVLLLVERQKAGTQDLKKYLSKKIQSQKADYREIKKRIKIDSQISQQDQAHYYSSWHFQAIHSLITVPGFQRAPLIAERLNLPIERINEVLSFLLEKGLLTEKSGEYSATTKQIHLPRTSPLISKLHSNWRIQSLASLDNMRTDDYHYSGLVTLSAGDMAKVREVLTKALADSIEIVKPSKEEKLALLAMDFYEL